MRATLFEFRNRWWIFFVLFFLAFSAYSIDQVNSGQAIADWCARRLGTVPTDNSLRLIFALGAFLVGMAALLRTWGTSYLQAEVMSDSRVHTDRLLADGPYRHVRNPLYLGNIMMGLGIGFMASRIGFLILSVGITVFVIRLLLREEAELLREQGEPYRRYCAAVPRLWFSLVPRVPRTGNTPQWGQGVRAELVYWLISLAMAVFAVTLNIKFWWAGFAVAVASVFLFKRPRTAQASPPAAK